MRQPLSPPRRGDSSAAPKSVRFETPGPQHAAQIDALEARLTRDHANWLGFCHNDLQCGNVMLDASSLESLRVGGGAATAAVAAVDLGTLVSRCDAALVTV